MRLRRLQVCKQQGACKVSLIWVTAMQAFHTGWPEHGEEAEPSRYGEKAARWIQIDESQSLQDILQRGDHVIPGIPAFFIVARETDFRERFLSQEQPLL